MKNLTKLLKTIGLCIILVMMTGIAKGTDYYLRTASKANLAGSWYDTQAASGGNAAMDFITGSNKFIIPATIINAVFNDTQNPNVIFGPNSILEVNGKFEINAGNNKTTTFTINGTINFTNSLQGQVTFVGAGTKSFTLGTSATLQTANSYGITGTNASIPAQATGYTVTLPTSANYEFNGGTQATTGLPATVKNLTITNAGTKTLAGEITVSGDLNINSGATLSTNNTNNYSLSLQGNFTNGGTFTTGSSAITLSGGNAQSIAGFTTTGTVTVNKTALTAATLSGTSSFTNLTITAGQLVIPAGGQVNVSGETAINVANGLTIESDPEPATGAGTGSFMTGTASTTTSPTTVTTIVNRYMSPRSWHMVSSSVSNQSISDFLTNNPNIPNNTVAGHTSERGMRGYAPSNNQWTNFYTNGEAGTMENGKGFLIRVKKGSGSTNQKVSFKGALQAGPVSAIGLTKGMWNCIGNPYTSALKLNSEGTTDNFLDVNATNLDMNYSGIYIWHQTEEELDDTRAIGSYTTISNASSLDEIQQGQAFMVKMNDEILATSVNFTYAMQSHNTGLALKSINDIWPTIQLMASTADSLVSATTIAFHEGMTKGLDPTYDAGLLKGGSSLEVYTRLLDDNGIPFDIQALPSNAYESTVIPVGIDFTTGGPISFSAKGMYLPSSCRPILEDRLTGIITNLSDKTYTTDLTANTAGTGRFYLHTSYSTTGAASRDKASLLSAWAVGNTEIIINGKINNGAVASLYDLQGRLIVAHVMREGIRDNISLPSVNSGIYLIQVRDQQKVHAMKVTIGQ